ncbi:MAG: carbohydrate binding domain-containing protein [Verrucomicrobia bacterium]|nr:carbohydrate binding domain-containing protein [Verrucomicrobiota bacterium]
MKSPSLLLVVGLAGILSFSTVRAEKPLALANGDFEQQLTGWKAEGDNGMSAAVPEAAHTGKLGLRVTDTSDTLGSSLAAAKFPAVPGKTYEVRFASRIIKGNFVGVYLRFYDAKGGYLNTPEKQNQNILRMTTKDTEWKDRVLKGVAPEGAVQVEVWVHSFTKGQVTADFDGFSLVEL